MFEQAARSLLAMRKVNNGPVMQQNAEQELIDATHALRVANERIRQLQERLLEAARCEERQMIDPNDTEHASRIKYAFLATLSHELRTPLSAILGWAQVLRRGMRNEVDLQRGLESIERNARTQAQLIDDLLDISNISAGKVVLNMQVVAPATIVMAALATARPAAHAKNIALTTTFDPTVTIAADTERLQQVIWNLLSNALKFTPKNGAVHIALKEIDGHVEITVSDTGAGIKPTFLTHIFEQFRQADSSTTRQHGGLGLGLSIVKHLVELHGGTVRASSDGIDCGASFTLQLPLAPGTPLPIHAPAPRPV
jgi:signal transduction histidine kinase